MQKSLFKSSIFPAIFFVLFFSTASFASAINDVSITEIVNFNLNTADTAAATVITASAGGQVTNLYVQTNYIDITIDNLSTVRFNTTVPGNYLKITKVSGSNDYTLLPTCPTTTATITGTGAQVVLRLRIYTTSQCTTTPVTPSGGGGGGTGIIHTSTETDPSCRGANAVVPFTDTIDHWGKAYIDALYLRCIVDGRTPTLFEPNDNATRAELVKIVLNTYNLGTAPWEYLYPDVFNGNWFAEYVTKATQLGIIEGYNEDGVYYFKPNQPVTRAEALKINLKTKGITDYNGYTVGFADVKQEDWYYEYVAFAQAKGVLEGYTEILDKEGYVRDFYSFSRSLALNDVGEDVRDLKEIMKQLGYYFGETDTNFDYGLERAVWEYQEDKGIDPAGIMGPITQGFLMNEELKPVSVVLFKPNNYITRAEIAKIDLLVEQL